MHKGHYTLESKFYLRTEQAIENLPPIFNKLQTFQNDLTLSGNKQKAPLDMITSAYY